MSLDLQSRCWSQAQCLRAKWLLHFQTHWLNCLKGPPPSNCKESQWIKKKEGKKKSNSHNSTCEMNPGQVQCVLICALPPLQTCREGRRSVRWKLKSLTWAVKLYLSGGEKEATPVLPNDELDRLAWLSSGLSPRGGVLGTRSGLAECTPEENKSVSN